MKRNHKLVQYRSCLDHGCACAEFIMAAAKTNYIQLLRSTEAHWAPVGNLTPRVFQLGRPDPAPPQQAEARIGTCRI